MVLVASSCNRSADASSHRIRVNQVGFTPPSQKLAVVPDSGATGFEIRTIGGSTVFSAELGESAMWPYSDEQVRVADFSDFRRLGRYIVVVDGVGESPPFEIRPDVLRPVSTAALKAFYLTRSHIDLEPDFAGPWARTGGHPDDQVRVHSSAASPTRPEGTIIASPDGWYDAGDYNKYFVNAAFAQPSVTFP